MRTRLATGCFLLLALSIAWADDDDARAWLERMNQALATRNYDGTFFHLRNGKVETLRIVHRVEDGKVAERLVSLDGTGREIIRNDEELTCYLPDQRRVLVESRIESGSLLGTLPTFDAGVADHYRVEKLAPGRLLGRPTQVIAVNPRDAFRFGYRLWIDEGTALPLKTQLCDEKGNVVEQILFANIAVPDSLPKSAVEPQRQYRRDAVGQAADVERQGHDFRVRLAGREGTTGVQAHGHEHAGTGGLGSAGDSPGVLGWTGLGFRVHRDQPSGGRSDQGPCESGICVYLLDDDTRPPGDRGRRSACHKRFS